CSSNIIFPHFLFIFSAPATPPALHSFPTRRSSDLRDLHLLCMQYVAGTTLEQVIRAVSALPPEQRNGQALLAVVDRLASGPAARSEEHTSELQSLRHLVCRLLLEKKKKI